MPGLDDPSATPLPHRSSFEVALVGRSGTEYPVRFDFDALFAIEARTGAPPLQLVSLLGSLSPSLNHCLVVVHAGMDCHARHRGADRPTTEAAAKRALADIGIDELCNKVARPLTAAYGFELSELVEEAGDADDAVDPPIATVGG